MKKILLLAVFAGVFAANSVFAEQKIGVVDLNKVILASPQLEASKAQMKAKFDPRQQEIIAAQKKLVSEHDSYIKNGPTMKKEDAKALEEKMMAQQKDLQEKVMRFQNDVNTAQTDAMQAILTGIEKVVTKVADEQKFDLVLSKMAAPYSAPALDITDQVIGEIKQSQTASLMPVAAEQPAAAQEVTQPATKQPATRSVAKAAKK